MRRNLEIVTSKDLKIKPTTLHDKAIRLLEDGIVVCGGLCVKAIPVLNPKRPCKDCLLSGICTNNLLALCNAVDEISGAAHCFSLATGNK